MAALSPTSNRAAIVLVQGSFQTPLVYKSFADALKAHGYAVYHPELPSCSNTERPEFTAITLEDDSKAVKAVLDQLVEFEHLDVIVVAHSYGGLVASNAIPEELSASFRKSAGLAGGVFHMFYFAAFVLEVGQSVLGSFGESPNNDVKPDGRFYLKNGASLIYNDLPDDDAAHWESRLVAQSHAVQETKMNRAAYKYIPSTYLVCDNDNAAPPQYQELFAATAGSAVEHCNAGHSPMLSQTSVLVEKIIEVILKAGPETRS